jgi:hypothetical protein
VRWLSNNYQWLLSLLVQVVIAYHLFYLSKRLSSTAKLEHKEKIKQKVDELLARIHREKLDGDVHLVNVKRYFKDYPSHQEKRFEGYSHFAAEIKATRFDGVEFFAGMPVEIFRTPGGTLSFRSRGNQRTLLHSLLVWFLMNG